MSLSLCSYWVLLFHFQQCVESICRLFCKIQYCRRYADALKGQVFHYAKWCLLMRLLKSALFRLCWSLYVCVCLCTLYQIVCLGVPTCACMCRRCVPVCFSRIDVPLSADGLMVQITVETMAGLRRSLREMKEYTVTCGRLDQSESQELVCVQWVEEKCTLNKGWVCPLKSVWQLPLCLDRTLTSKDWFFSSSAVG